MSYKKWIVGFLLLTAILIALYCLFNYKLDVYNYWKAGEDNIRFVADTYTRECKLRHISQNPDKYKGYIIGDSKVGLLDTDLISEYEGGEFYNVSVPWGCFEEYEAYIKYIAENTTAKKIILETGSIDVNYYSREQFPAVITESKLDDIKEALKFLMVNPLQLVQDLSGKRIYDYANGMRNYEKQYEEMKEEGDSYFDRAVRTQYDDLMEIVFSPRVAFLAHDQNVAALARIVETCRAHDIELVFIIAPSFVSEFYQYEGQEYWRYLREMVQFTNYWDFTGFNDVNRNPYNFINFQHYNEAVGTKIVNVIYGQEEMEGFGTYVTMDNADSYCGQRGKVYNEMETIYRETGTLELFDKNHSSYIKY